MTETRTGSEAIVTPSSSLLRAVVSTMGTLTFTSVASFYYYYYRQQNTTTVSHRMGLFQSVASLWGWPAKRQRSLSAERRRRRKKSKSPGRKQKEASSSDDDDGEQETATKEAEWNAHNGMYDVVSDQQSNEKDVCLKLFPDDEEGPPSHARVANVLVEDDSDEECDECVDTTARHHHVEDPVVEGEKTNADVVCEDASDEECDEQASCADSCDSFQQDEDRELQEDSASQSAYGIQEIAFHFTAPVVDSTTLSQIEQRESSDAQVTVEEAAASVLLEPAELVQQEQNLQHNLPAGEEDALESDTVCFVEQQVDVTIIGDLSNSVQDANESTDVLPVDQTVILEDVACVYQTWASEIESENVVSSDDETIELLHDDDEESAEEDNASLDDETDMNYSDNSIDVKGNSDVDSIHQESQRGIAFEDQVLTETAEPLSSEVNETVVEELDDCAEHDFQTSDTTDVIRVEDPALVTDDEIFQCDVDSSLNEEDQVHGAPDSDDVSSSDDGGEGSICCVVEGNPMLFRAGNSTQDSNEEDSNEPASFDSVSKEFQSASSADDEIPDILQLDTLTFDDTTVTEDGAHVELGSRAFSESPVNAGKDASRSRSYIGKTSILVMCGVLVLSVYYPQNSSEPSIQPDSPDNSDVASFILHVASETDFAEIEVPNVTSATERFPSDLPVGMQIVKLPVKIVESFCWGTADFENAVLQVIFEPAPIGSQGMLNGTEQNVLTDLVTPHISANFNEVEIESHRSSQRVHLAKSSSFKVLQHMPTFISTLLKIDIWQMLSKAVAQMTFSKHGKQGALGPHGMYHKRATVSPVHLLLQKVLSAIRAPMNLSEQAKDAFMASHGVSPMLLFVSSEPVSIRPLLSSLKLAQRFSQQMLSDHRKAIQLTESTKEAFAVSHGICGKPLIVSPVSINAKALLQRMCSPIELSSNARAAVLGSHGLYTPPVTLFPQENRLVQTIFKYLETSTRTAVLHCMEVQRHLQQVQVLPTKLSAKEKEALLGSYGLYNMPMTLFPEQLHLLKSMSALLDTSKEVAVLQFLAARVHLEQVQALASSTMQLSKAAREVFIGSYGLYGDEALDLASVKMMIENAVSKLSETLYVAFWGVYLDLLIRVPEQKIFLEHVSSKVAGVAGKANADLRKRFSKSLTTIAIVNAGFRRGLTEISSKTKVSSEMRRSLLGLHGQYFESHEVESNMNTGDSKMLFIELWSTIASCSYFLDHSVVLWSKVGDEVIQLLVKS